jgi:hypothetical protein
LQPKKSKKCKRDKSQGFSDPLEKLFTPAGALIHKNGNNLNLFLFVLHRGFGFDGKAVSPAGFDGKGQKKNLLLTLRLG